MSQIEKKWMPVTIGLILVLLIATFTVTTGAVGGDVQQFEQGTATCTITHATCLVTVTFPTAFASVPNHIEATWGGVNFGVNHADAEVVIGNVYFQSDNAETWVNMPAAMTEFYGNMNHETTIITNGVPTSALGAEAFITCIKGSNSPNATLRPMYSGQGSQPGFELAAVHGALDLKVDDAGTCLGFAGIGPFIEVSGFSGLAPGFATGDNVFLVGISGAGVGDTPIFNNAGLSIVEDFQQTPAICVNSATVCDGSGLVATTTQFRISANIPFTPIGSYVVNFDWSAYLCIKGGLAC